MICTSILSVLALRERFVYQLKASLSLTREFFVTHNRTRVDLHYFMKYSP